MTAFLGRIAPGGPTFGSYRQVAQPINKEIQSKLLGIAGIQKEAGKIR
jgi:hypothetical protein